MNQQQQTIEGEQSTSFTLPILQAEEDTGLVDVKAAVEEENEEENKEESAADTSTLTALLQHEAVMRRRETYGTLVWAGVFLAAVAWMTHYISTGEAGFKVSMLLFFLTMMSIGFFTLAHIVRRTYRRKSALTRELEQTHSKEQIGLLIEATRVESTPVRNLAKHALIRLLPTMQASDAPLLTDAHRSRLLYFLNISPNDTGYRDLTELFSRSACQREIDLRRAILKSLEQVGGAKELPVVERLSKGLPNLQSASKVPGEVKDAALECLPYLQARAGEQRASEQLLRASGLHATPNDILLRPAPSRPDAAPEQLLRPGEAG